MCTFRLLVNLSQPAKLCFLNEIPGDKGTRNYYMQVETHLQGYKEVSGYHGNMTPAGIHRGHSFPWQHSMVGLRDQMLKTGLGKITLDYQFLEH